MDISPYSIKSHFINWESPACQLADWPMMSASTWDLSMLRCMPLGTGKFPQWVNSTSSVCKRLLVGGFQTFFIFHFIYGMSSETPWRTPSFFRGVGIPPTSLRQGTWKWEISKNGTFAMFRSNENENKTVDLGWMAAAGLLGGNHFYLWVKHCHFYHKNDWEWDFHTTYKNGYSGDGKHDCFNHINSICTLTAFDYWIIYYLLLVARYGGLGIGSIGAIILTHSHITVIMSAVDSPPIYKLFSHSNTMYRGFPSKAQVHN